MSARLAGQRTFLADREALQQRSSALDFIVQVWDEILKARGDVDIERLYRENESDLTLDDLRPHLLQACDDARAAFAAAERVGGDLKGDTRYGEFLVQAGIEQEGKEDRWGLYKEVFHSIRNAARKEEKEAREREEQERSPILYALKPRVPFIEPYRRTHDMEASARIAVIEQQHVELANKIRDLRQECADLERQMRDIDTDLDALGKPKGIWLGVAVLTYFSGAGVVLPIMLLPRHTGDLRFRNWVIIGFITGLAGVLGYLVKLVSSLQPDDRTEE